MSSTANHIAPLPLEIPSAPSAVAAPIPSSGTFVVQARGATFTELIARQAARNPRATAVQCGEQSLTYAELESLSNKLAHFLVRKGLAPHSRIAVFLDRSVELVVTLLAIAKAGSAFVPLDPIYPRSRRNFVLENARPTAIVTTSELAEDYSIETVKLDTVPWSTNESDDPIDLATLSAGAYVIYTSGSTGTPKGVRIQHRSVARLLYSMSIEPGIDSSDTLLSVTTITFDIAVLELFLPLIAGAKVVVARKAEIVDGAALSELMRKHGVTMLQATPVTWQLLVDSGWRDSRLKMLCGGEALSRKLANQLLARGGELWNMYGPTETTIWSSVLRVEAGDGPVLLGPPIPYTHFYVLNERLEPVDDGEPGELFIGGDGVSLGYVDLPQLNAAKFLKDSFRQPCADPDARIYRTGDIVRRKVVAGRECYEFLGRSDTQVKVRGYRIELGEIESTLLRHHDVVQAVATAGNGQYEEPLVAAYVVLAQDAGISKSEVPSKLRNELQALCNTFLPAYMHPSAIVRLSRLPKTANGKIDRKALPPPPPASFIVSSAPQSVGQRLSEIWRSLLSIDKLEPDANFFLIGGQSLIAMELLERIERAFGVRLTIGALFGAPTLAEQTQLIERFDDRHFDFRSIVQLHREGTEQPLIVIHNTGVYYYHLAQLLGPQQPVTALQSFDPAQKSMLPTTVEDIAADYVQLIRKSHPRGPYRLLGWCIGGVLAFEIACQLRQQAEQISFLGLIDAWAPGHLQRMPKFNAWLSDRSYRLQLIWTDWIKVRSRKHSFREFLRNRVVVKKLISSSRSNDRSLLKLYADRHLSGEHYDRWLGSYLEEVASRHTPRQFDGRMTLFRSSREPSGVFLDPAMGWKAFAQGGIDSATLDGDHFTVFRGAGLRQLAEHLASVLSTKSPTVNR